MTSNNETKGADQSHLNAPILMLKHLFHTLSLTLLTLLLPISFLLLAKLTSSSPSSSLPPPPYAVLRLLVSFLAVSSLLYSLTGHFPRPRTAIAWAVVVTFQVCISIGIEATISFGIKPLVPSETSRLMWIERTVFFLGLYNTMLHWMRVFVKPVVDDTVYGVEVREGRADRVAIGVAFSSLWLWMLRGKVEPLVLAAGKGGLLDGFAGWEGFVLWLVSYSTVVNGMVRVVEVIFWVGSSLFWFLCCRGEEDVGPLAHDPRTDDVVLLL